ncbi:MAG TPA: 6,7-dimethyl-8-ribityllumazine synthase [Pyrinomonadaceae bacterium]|nr:6,7-dimethyl-8-ribityllumazine synthase [Pyrinomonadaceae bacterium]
MKTELERLEIDASSMRFAIVVSRWNNGYTSRLEKGAREGLGAAAVETYVVPGAFELPLAAKAAAQTGYFDAVIALGVIIRGDTPHFDYVAGQAAAGIMQASLETGIPVMFGVITADTPEQAEARCGVRGDNKGYEAALSAVEMVAALKEIKGESKAVPHVV